MTLVQLLISSWLAICILAFILFWLLKELENHSGEY